MTFLGLSTDPADHPKPAPYQWGVAPLGGGQQAPGPTDRPPGATDTRAKGPAPSRPAAPPHQGRQPPKGGQARRRAAKAPGPRARPPEEARGEPDRPGRKGARSRGRARACRRPDRAEGDQQTREGTAAAARKDRFTPNP